MTVRPTIDLCGSDEGDQAGFTLVELLIALALVSVIAVTLMGALGFSRRALGTAQEAEEATTVVSVQDFLRSTIGAAQPIGEPGSDGLLRLAFEGSSDRLTYIVNLAGRTTTAGLYRIKLVQDSSSSPASSLTATLEIFRPNSPQPEGSPAIEPRVLLQHISGVAFRYYGSMEPGGNAEWRDEWVAARQLPTLISVSLNLPESDPRSWPELVIATKLR